MPALGLYNCSTKRLPALSRVGTHPPTDLRSVKQPTPTISISWTRAVSILTVWKDGLIISSLVTCSTLPQMPYLSQHRFQCLGKTSPRNIEECRNRCDLANMLPRRQGLGPPHFLPSFHIAFHSIDLSHEVDLPATRHVKLSFEVELHEHEMHEKPTVLLQQHSSVVRTPLPASAMRQYGSTSCRCYGRYHTRLGTTISLPPGFRL